MHPKERELIDFVLAESGEAQRVATERHLGEPCPECQETVARYRELLEVMRTDRSAEPPAAWVHRAIALGRSSWLRKVREWCGERAQDLGRVVFDSFAGPGLAPAGVRSVDVERRMRFEAEGVELDVRVEPLGRGGVVTGQFVTLGERPGPLAGAGYLLTAGTADAVDGVTDELGEFTNELPRLEELRIRVRVGDRLVVFDVPENPSPGD